MDFEFVRQNWILFVALVVIIAMILADPIRKRVAGIHALGVNQLTRLMSDEKVVIVDVSDDAEYKRGHINESIHVPLKDLESKIDSLKKHKEHKIVIACATGTRSGKAAGVLRKAGFTDVATLRDGIQGWSRENMPLVKS